MKKGFTLVELVIVIVIVGILSIVAVPIYRGYIEKAKITEGKALVSAIRTAQSVYYAEHGAWYTTPAYADYDPVLGIDARGNKYYTTFFSGSNNGVIQHASAIADNGDYMGINWSVTLEPVNAEGQTTPYYFYFIDGKYSYSGA